MILRNERRRFERGRLEPLSELPTRISILFDAETLRWAIVDVNDEEVVIEATLLEKDEAPRWTPVVGLPSGRFVVLSLVPTGIGCSIGGYAGDAGPVTSLLAATSDILITNPNAVNASDFIALPNNAWYVEGHAIDCFARGLTRLHRPRGNSIGLVIEASESTVVDRAVNVANAVRATHGVNIVHILVTREKIGSRCIRSPSGSFVGAIDRPDVLMAACEDLERHGADAIAITTDVQDVPEHVHAEHFAGGAPNPIGGVEAVLSHFVTRRLRLPAAHAPLVNRMPPDLRDGIVDPRGAGEIVSRTGLACILVGLASAPQLRLRATARTSEEVGMEDLHAVVAPASALGSVPVLATRSRRVPVIAVRANRTILDVTNERLRLSDVYEVETYAEAAGLLVALRQGLAPETLRRPIERIAMGTVDSRSSVTSSDESGHTVGVGAEPRADEVWLNGRP